MRIDDLIKQKGFVITLEVNPVAGSDPLPMREEFALIKGRVDAVNITDMPGANLKMSSWAGALWAIEEGLNPIVQYTCRDRNSLALKGDIWGLASFGIENMLILGGDPPHIGDHPKTKPVYDMDTLSLIRWISENTRICIGAAANPGSEDLDKEINRMAMKIDAGARFFQTQAVYDSEKFLKFIEKARALNVPIIAGIIPLRSEKMAQFMNKNIPGIHVPEKLIERISRAKDKITCGQEIAVKIIEQIRPYCQGIHIMPIKNIKIALPILDRIRGGKYV